LRNIRWGSLSLDPVVVVGVFATVFAAVLTLVMMTFKFTSLEVVIASAKELCIDRGASGNTKALEEARLSLIVTVGTTLSVESTLTETGLSVKSILTETTLTTTTVTVETTFTVETFAMETTFAVKTFTVEATFTVETFAVETTLAVETFTVETTFAVEATFTVETAFTMTFLTV
jgi:hypothetical protein